MNLDKLQKTYLEEAEQSDSFRSLLKKIGSGEKHIRISGLGGSAISYILAAAAKNISRPVCIISASRERAEQIFDDLDFFGVDHSFHFPTWEILPYDQEEPHTEIASRQLDSYEALVMIKNGSKFSKGAAPIITAPLEAFLQKLLSPEFYKQRSLVVEWGKEIDTEALAKQLVDAGYERLPVVKSRGEFSIRGGIIDIFPLTEPEPLRLDLFGDEIESIRYFDPVTQRSVNPTDTIENVIIPPARILEMIHQSIDNDVPLSMVTEYLTPDTIFIIDEPDAFSEKDHHFEEIVERQYFEASAHGLEHLSPDKLYTDWDILENEIDRFTRISHTALPVQDSSQKDDIRFVTASFRDVKPSLDYYMDMISTKQRDDYLINVVCDNEGQARKKRDPGDPEALRGASRTSSFLLGGSTRDLFFPGLRRYLSRIGRFSEDIKGGAFTGKHTLEPRLQNPRKSGAAITSFTLITASGNFSESELRISTEITSIS